LVVAASCSTGDSKSGSNDAGLDLDGYTIDDRGAIVDKDGNVIVPPPIKPDGSLPPIEGNGHVVYKAPGGDYQRVEATPNARPSNVSSALQALSPGRDNRLQPSVDGKWIVLNGSRFGCASDDCLSVVKGDLSSGGAIVLTNGQKITGVEGRPGITVGGDTVVYPGKGGPHALDLFVTHRVGGQWSPPVGVTSSMTSAYAHDLRVTPDSLAVVFDCGPDPYGAAGTAICEVNLDGTGFRVVARPSELPGGSAVHHPSKARDGSIVFEGDWGGEQIYRKVAGGTPAKVSATKAFPDDNTPCVLPNGRIASLWLNAPGNPSGLHELKIMNADGTSDFMLVTGLDIIDEGISCGN
jgi:hypothetical protein